MRPWARWTLRVAFAAAGIALVVYLVVRAGPARVLGAVVAAAPLLPLAILLHAGRIACDAAGTYFGLGRAKHRVPWPMMLRAQLIGSASGHILPGGRLGEEGVKAALLTRYTGAGQATAAAVTNEAVTLLAGALFSIPCALAAAQLEAPTLVWALVIHGLVLLGLGLALRAAMRKRRWLAWLRRRLTWIPDAADDFVATARDYPLIPPKPLAAMLAARVAEGATFIVLAYAVGIDLSAMQALAVLGIQMVSVAAGTFLPAQLGVGEAAFALWAGALGAAPAAALAVPLVSHLIRLLFVAIGALTPVLWRVRDQREGELEISRS